jgi:hypothetical protein
MDLNGLKNFYHTHCKFRLRNGKVVFGVIYPDNLKADLLYFTSYQEHKRLFNDWSIDMPGFEPQSSPVLLNAEDIIAVEPIMEEQQDLN